jgi:hypothetical protein
MSPDPGAQPITQASGRTLTEMRPERRDALLTAIAKARGWIDDVIGKRVVARNVARQRVGLAGAEDGLDHAPNGIIVELCSGADYAGVAHGNRSGR